jgi:hypothetical protein
MAAQRIPRARRLDLQPVMHVAGRDLCGAAFDEHTHALNVSGGGLCFETRHNLAIGARLSLQILIPYRLRRRFGNRALYPVRAIVCRVERPPTGDVFRVGARMVGP